MIYLNYFMIWDVLILFWIDYTIFKNITAIDKKKLKENSYVGNTNTIALQQIRKLLYRKLLDKDHRQPKQFTIQEDHNNALATNTQKNSEKILLKRYGLLRIVGF